MTVYLLLALAAFFAAAISGAAGFGGALLLLPMLTHTVGVTEAVPLLTVAQLVGNLARAGFAFTEIRWRPVGMFLVTAIPFAALGATSFVALPKPMIVRLVGAAILLFVLVKSLGLIRMRAGGGVLLVGGAAGGFLSGLVGSAGPLGAAVFLSLNLPPVAYVASEAVTAIAMHGVKMAIYGSRLAFSPSFWPLALLLGGAMVLGTWAGKLLIERMPVIWFRRIVTGLLVVIAAQMVVTG